MLVTINLIVIVITFKTDRDTALMSALKVQNGQIQFNTLSFNSLENFEVILSRATCQQP